MAASKILILEDDLNVARAYEKVLSDEGNAVVVCSSFHEARECLRSQAPDAVLADVRVGEFNGLQLAMLFRQQRPDGRLVIVTGYEDTAIRREVRSLHGEFLVKPIKLDQLRSAFRP